MVAQKVLLVVPPYYALRGMRPATMGSLGVLCLTSFLRRAGIECAAVVSDLLIETDAAMASNKMGRESQGAKCSRYGDNVLDLSRNAVWSALRDVVIKFAPMVVGVSATTPAIDSAYRVAEIVKEVAPSAKVVFGGFHPTFASDEVLRRESVDYVVRGEGEVPLLRLVESIAHGSSDYASVPSLSYRVGGVTTHNAAFPHAMELDRLPFPARDPLALDSSCTLDEHPILAARGCAYDCAFCCDRAFWGKVRCRSVPNVVSEIVALLSEFPQTRRFTFCDGTFTYRKSYTIELCNAIGELGEDLSMFCTARFDNLDERVCGALSGAGFDTLYLGAESGDVDVLKTMNKSVTPALMREKLTVIRGAGLKSHVGILIGVPGESAESLRHTIELMEELPADMYDVNCFVPLPGSAWYRELPEDVRNGVSWFEHGFKDTMPYLFSREDKGSLAPLVQQVFRVAEERSSLERQRDDLFTTPQEGESDAEICKS